MDSEKWALQYGVTLSDGRKVVAEAVSERLYIYILLGINALINHAKYEQGHLYGYIKLDWIELDL